MISLTWENIISLGALLISLYSLFSSNKNKIKQQILEKEMQNNEFKFTKQKIWYDKQNKVLDASLQKLTEISSNIKSFDELMIRELQRQNYTTVFSQEIFDIKDVIEENNNYLKANKHYFPESLDELIGLTIKSNEDLLNNLDPEMKIIYSLSNDEIKNYLDQIHSSIHIITNEMRTLFLD